MIDSAASIERRRFLATLASGLTASIGSTWAQPPSRPVRIGVLGLRRRTDDVPTTSALLEGLSELGYVEGRNLVIDYPDLHNRDDRLPQVAAELVRKQVDVILVLGPGPLQAAQNATRTIPVVMVASSADPVAEGVARSLARPGGNVTGLTYAEPDRFKKQLELLKSVAPGIARVAALWDFDVEIYRRQWQAPLTDAARVLGVGIADPFRVHDAQELPARFAAAKASGIDALLVAAGNFMLAARAQVGELALRHRLPAIAAFKEFPAAGLLMSYGPDLPDINRRAAGYVDRIVKGAKPGDLPIELPNKFELAINLKTARALGLTVPQALLLRATQVLE